MSGVGELEVKSSTVIWKIDNFSQKCSKPGENFGSPIFESGDYKKKIYWNIKLYPFGYNTESEGYLSFFLNFLPQSAITEHVCSFEISLLNGTEIDMNTRRISKIERFTTHNCSWGWNWFIKRSELLNQESTYLKQNVLTVLCSISEAPIKNTSYVANSLVKEYESLYETGDFSDVTIVMGEEKIKAHKAILSARSKVFSAMLKHDMVESNTNIIAISDVEFSVMKIFLSFLYSGKVDNIDKFSKPLLAVANKYDVDDLKILCGNVLLDSLTVDNACELVCFFDLHNCHKLQLEIIDYMIENMKAIIKTNGFNDLSSSNQALFKKIFCKLVEKKL